MQTTEACLSPKNMRLRLFYTVALFISLAQVTYFVQRQIKLVSLGTRAANELRSLESKSSELRSAFRSVSDRNSFVGTKLQRQYGDLKSLVETSRRNYVRIKGVPEKPNEMLEEKVWLDLANCLYMLVNTIQGTNTAVLYN